MTTSASLTDRYENGATDAFDIELVTGDGGIVGLGSALGVLSLNLATEASVGYGSAITAGTDLDITAATALDPIEVKPNGTVGGFYGDGKVNAQVTGNISTKTVLGSSVHLTAGDDLSLQATTTIEGIYAQTSGGVGGLAASGGQSVKIDFGTPDYTGHPSSNSLLTAVTIGSDGVITAGGTATVRSDTGFAFTASADQTTGGGITKNSVYAGASAVETTTTFIDQHTQITAASITLAAVSSQAYADVDASCDTTGVVNSDTHATAEVNLEITAELHTHLAQVVAPQITLLAQTKGLNASSQSEVAAKGTVAEVTSEALHWVDETADVWIQSGLLQTHDLSVTADTLTDQQPVGMTAKAKSSNLFATITYITTAFPEQRLTSIELDCYVVYQAELALVVDAAGNIVRSDGLSAHIDPATGDVVVDDFFYNGSQVPPQATLVWMGGSGSLGGIIGSPAYQSYGATECTITNESSRTLRLGFIGIGLDHAASWSVTTVCNGTITTQEIAGLSVYPTSLEVDSVGNIVLSQTLELPSLTVSLHSDGAITSTGANWIDAQHVTLEAGTNLGTQATPLSVETSDMSVAAGGNLYLTVSPTLQAAFATFSVSCLTAGGLLSVTFLSAYYVHPDGTQELIPSSILFTGPVSAGTDLSIAIQSTLAGGSVLFKEAITAGGNVTIDTPTVLLLARTITAGGTVSLTSGADVEAGPDELITARNLTIHADGAAGSSGDAAIKVVFTGGSLNAYGQTDVEVTSMSGQLPVAYLFVPLGSATLTATDTAGSNDLVVLIAGATLDTKTGIWLNAGDGISVGTGAHVQTDGSINIALDTQTVDPDPGQGVTFTYLPGTFVSTSSAPVTRIETGDDDDTIIVTDLSDNNILDIRTGGGNDQLQLTKAGSTYWIAGDIYFDGGDGTDMVLIDNSAVDLGPHGTLALNDNVVMPYLGYSIPSVQMSGFGGLWYAGLENLNIKLGYSAHNTVNIDATDAEVESVSILGSFGSETFQVGQGTDHMLSAIHGMISLDGGTGSDSLSIVQNNFVAGLTFPDDCLTATTFTGQGMDGGVQYHNIDTLSIQLGSSDDYLTVTGLAPGVSTSIDLGGGDDTLSLDGSCLATAGTIPTMTGGSGRDTFEVYDTDPSTYVEVLYATRVARWRPDGVCLYTVDFLSTFEDVAVRLGVAGGRLEIDSVPTGTTTIFGGAGADEITVVQGPALNSVLDIRAGDGDDTLNVWGDACLKTLYGKVFFEGDGGTDKLSLHATDATAATTSVMMTEPSGVPAPHGGESFGEIEGLDMPNTGIFYQSEEIEICLTDFADTVYLQGTAPGTQYALIDALGGDDQFYVGATGTLLADIHGLMDLEGRTGTGDKLWIENQTCTEDFDTGDDFDSVLTAWTFTGQGMDQGLEYFDFENIGVFLGDGRDSLAIDSLPVGCFAQVNMGGGDDRLSVGYSAGLGGLNMDILGVAGGDGNDEFIVNDTGDLNCPSAAIFDNQILGFTPKQIGVYSDFEAMGVILGSGGADLDVTDPSLPLTIRGTSGPVHVTLESLQSTQSVTFYGGSAADVMYLGSPGIGLNVYGPVQFFGGDGDDVVWLYELASSGSLWFDGQGGDDSLDAYQTFTDTYYHYPWGTARDIDGSVVFLGNDGNDSLLIDESLCPSGGDTVHFDATILQQADAVVGRITGLDMAQGIDYSAENVTLYLGPVGYQQSNQVYLDGTADETTSLHIAHASPFWDANYLEDDIYVGMGAPLPVIHGLVTLDTISSHDQLTISNADSWSDWDDAVLTQTSFTGMGLRDGISLPQGMPNVTIAMGQCSNIIELDGIPSDPWYAYSTGHRTNITNLDPDDVVFLSEDVADTPYEWLLNGHGGIGVTAHQSGPAVEPQTPHGLVDYLQYPAYGSLKDAWASDGSLSFEYSSPSWPFDKYFSWTTSTTGAQMVAVYARDSYGLVTAAWLGTYYTNIPPAATLADQTAPEGPVQLTGSFSDPGIPVGESYSINWSVTDPITGDPVASGYGWGMGSGATDMTVYGSIDLPVGTYGLTLFVSDGQDTSSASATLVVTNVTPTVDAGPDLDGEPLAVDLHGAVSDPGTACGETVASHWVVTNAEGVVVAESDDLDWTFQAPAFGTYTAVLTATDEHGAASSDAATITLHNIAPIANAGPDVVQEPLRVSLNGTVTDPGLAGGETISAHWVVTNSAGTVVGESHDLAWTFQAPAFGTYHAVLTVTDEYGATSSDEAVLTLANLPPVVDAGPDTTVGPGFPVVLTGTFTDGGFEPGDVYPMGWTIRNSAGVVVGAQAGSTMTFTTHTAGVYTAVFAVTDQYGATGTDSRIINVVPIVPVVNAGSDVSIDLNAGPVTLTGSFTDPAAWANETYTIGWNITNSGGTQVATGTDLSMTYTPAAAGTYTATLTVTDSEGNVGSDALTITANSAPFRIEAGAQIVAYAGSDTGTVEVARFGDQNLGYRPADWYQVTINWGDGATSNGTLTWVNDYSNGWPSNGYWEVTGSHTYGQSSSTQPNQVYCVTTTVFSPANPGQYGINHDRSAAVATSAAINTSSLQVTSITVNPATPEDGQPASITITFSDSPSSGPHFLWIWWMDEDTWYWGHQCDIAAGQRAITVSHAFNASWWPGQPVWVGANVQRGSSWSGYTNVAYTQAQVQTRVTILPAIPRAEAGADVTVPEGQAVALSGTVSNLSGYTAGWQVIDVFSQNVIATGSGTTLNLTPPEVSRYKAIFTATSGSTTASDALLINVTNVAPVVSATSVVNADFSVDLAGSFSDPGQAQGEQYGTTWQIFDEDNALVASADTANVHFAPPVLGTYSAVFAVTDDESGSGSTTLLLQLGAAPPAAPVITGMATDTGTPGDGITSDNTLILQGTAEANDTVTVCRDGNSIGTTAANSTGIWSFDYTGTSLADGTYSFTATAANAAGSTSPASAAFTVKIDTITPAAPTVAGIANDTGTPGDGITSDKTLVVRGTAEANSTVTVYREGSSIGTTTADGSGNWSFDYTGTSLADGTYSFSATAMDTAANTSVASAGSAVRVDTLAPAVPVVTGIANDTGTPGDGITSDRTLAINGTAEVNSAVTVYRDGNSLGTTTADGSGNWSFNYTGTSLADGSYSFSAAAMDMAGNTSAASAGFTVRVDTSAPAAPVVTGIADDTGAPGDGITSDKTLVINGAAEANSKMTVYREGNSIGTATADGSSHWSFDYTATTLADGTYGFTATATDRAGNTSAASAAFPVVVDTAAPVVTVDSLATTDATPALTGTVDDPNATVAVMILNHTYAATNNGDGTWTLPASTIAPALPVGVYDVAVQATDAAGNAGADVTTNELTVYVLGDMNWDGVVSIVGDILPFVRLVYFGDYDWYQQQFPGKNPVLPGDFNGDGVLSIIGDVPGFVDYVYFGRTPVQNPTGPVFAQFSGTIDTADGFATVDIKIGPESFALNRSGTVGLGFRLYATAGSSLDPDIVEILDSQGQPLSPLYTKADLPGGQDSLTLCELPYGQYQLRIRGQNGSTGSYCLDAFLLGDADGDRNVDGSDTLLLQSAYGSHTGDSQYVAAADADEDGVISSFDLAQEIRNFGAVTTLTLLHLTAALNPAPASTTAEGLPLTDQPSITVMGQTNPGLTVALDIDGDGHDDNTTTASSTGAYIFSLFTLSECTNNLHVRAADTFGQLREVPLTVVLRVPLQG